MTFKNDLNDISAVKLENYASKSSDSSCVMNLIQFPNKFVAIFFM